MTSSIILEAEIRTNTGRGASRRLRRLEDKVPAVVYGGDKEVVLLHLQHNKVLKALESESIYSSVFNITVHGEGKGSKAAKTEHVVLKDLQRHPYKAIIMHMDFQRVSDQDVLVKMIPLHFINEEKSLGVKDGGIVNHSMTQVEVRCKVKDLPEFIEVDLADLALNGVIHLTDLKLPKGVKLALDPTQGDHDHPVVSIHLPRAEVAENAAETIEESAVESGETDTTAEGLDAEASSTEE